MEPMPQTLKVASGTLLASAPDLLDPNFMHTVSVICEHADEGAYGLVVNKLSSLTIDRLLPDHSVFGSLQLPVGWGGPVGADTLQVLHRIPAMISGGDEIAGGLYLGCELDELADFVLGRSEEEITDQVRLVLGYAGWGARQLEMELSAGSWLPLPISADLVFQGDQESTWQTAVRSLGAEGEKLAGLPPDIRWN